MRRTGSRAALAAVERHQEALAKSFGEHFDRQLGYGLRTRYLLSVLKLGGDWRELSRQSDSYGNGGAMRITPLGAYFADDMAKIVEQTKLATEITHCHIEGIAGAIAVAVATAVAWNYRNERLTRSKFIDLILPSIPTSFVKDQCIVARDLNTADIAEVIKKIGNGSDVTAQDSVPLVLYCAGESLYNFEEAFWKTALAGGDTDTTCAMVCGIVAMSVGYEGLPSHWQQNRQTLADWALGEENNRLES
jgi:ADP-ribosylglycohydrolase